MPKQILDNKYKVWAGSQDLSAAALAWSTPTSQNFDHVVSMIAVKFSTAVSREVTIQVKKGQSTFDIVVKSAWSGQSILITDEFKMDAEMEILINADKTSGIAKFMVVYEQMNK